MPKGYFQNGMPINLGRKHSEESKLKTSKKLKGKIPSNLSILLASAKKFQKGHIHSQNWHEAMKKMKGNTYGFKKGQVAWNKGLTKTIDKRLNYERPTKFKKGNGMNKREKNPMWKGGISFLPYPTDWTDDLKESIRKRDNYVCQECGLHQDELKGRNKKLDVHHIDYDKDNLNPENLITLCKSCHTKTTFDREYWTNYFKEK